MVTAKRSQYALAQIIADCLYLVWVDLARIRHETTRLRAHLHLVVRVGQQPPLQIHADLLGVHVCVCRVDQLAPVVVAGDYITGVGVLVV